MLELSAINERAILVQLSFSAQKKEPADFSEFYELALSAGVSVAHTIRGVRQLPDPKYFLGTGKAEEVRQAVIGYQAVIVIVNHTLSAAQQRNLERFCQCRVIDRAGLILDIFAQRARTFEGKLQVELAQLEHLATRLVRGWTHLERQRGGIGLRGPGETQLETDRRLVRKRIDTLKARLEKVRSQRAQNRKARQRQAIPVISLVGYTNVGKSTLFNRLTGAEVYSANQLFATLDPTLRGMQLPHQQQIIVADTVGFIRHLPHELIAAFRATLEETLEATLLLHVIDASSPEKEAQIEQVNAVLAEIGASSVPVLQVYNKIDLLPDALPQLQYHPENPSQPMRVWLSAASGTGLNLLQQAIQEHLSHSVHKATLAIPPEKSRIRAMLYQQGAVKKEYNDAQGNSIINVELAPGDLLKLKEFVLFADSGDSEEEGNQ